MKNHLIMSTAMSTVGDNLFSLDQQKKYIIEYSFEFCKEVSMNYEKIAKVGHGTYGQVFKARDKSDNKFVALKQVLTENDKEGFPITYLREIKLLRSIKHENIISFIDVCRTKSTENNACKPIFYLVFDFCEHDLAGLLKNPSVKFSLSDIKAVMKQLFNALYYIHANNILHRDIKTANILITKTGVLKVADFGLSRFVSKPRPDKPNSYTTRVVTLWYRPPELLLGDRNYGPPVDMWGAGCIMAEMWTRSPILQGATEQHQLALCAKFCGSITPEVWPGVEKLELYQKIQLPQDHKRKVKERLRPYVRDQYALDLLDQIFILNPEKRIDTDNALMHDFFWEEPRPSNLGVMISKLKFSNFEFIQPRATTAQPEQSGFKDQTY